jgi:hypothetical protein
MTRVSVRRTARCAASKQNWFDTLNAALEAEGLVEAWPVTKSMSYGEHFSFTYDDGSRNGHFVSVYRDEPGRYERPVHYRR